MTGNVGARIPALLVLEIPLSRTGQTLLPVGPVGHAGGEHVLALPVGVVQGLVAAGQVVLACGFGVIAALLGGGASAAARRLAHAGSPTRRHRLAGDLATGKAPDRDKDERMV